MKIPLSYRYYKLSDLEQICGINTKDAENLLNEVKNIVPSEAFATILKRNLLIPMKNEKAKSELIVMPLLVEMWYINQQFKPLSGLSFNIDSARGLKGRCDFLISAKPQTTELDSPIVCVYEAKDDNIENWYGPCGAEMYAARLFNQQEGNEISTIHGAVTNGFNWQFLKLEEQTLYIDAQRYGLANLPQLLGAIQKVYDYYK